MKPRVLVREAARRDLAECAAFIARSNPRAAADFLDSARRTFARLAGLPSLGAAWEPLSPSLRDFRRFRVTVFGDYLIFYRPIERGVEIVRVLHGARDIEALFE